MFELTKNVYDILDVKLFTFADPLVKENNDEMLERQKQ